ncbi:MAG: VCBS repeat-containing protein [Tannerella sp.]|nr:VCBS repeat-containing protein [Tannerella sp.]
MLTDSSPQVEGCLISFTWDNTVGLPVAQRLKVSFLLEHQDGSINTGFSLFDFDNDGIMDICYRDERTLRIISARRSYVTVNATTANSPSVIRLSKLCYSYTGFEYPAIADVDNDGSADIVVMGRSNTTVGQTRAFILAVEGANRDLAPAPPVWNQFHYHPMKINADLKTPLGVFHPLDSDYCFYKNASDPEPTFVYNSNIMQAVISSSFETPDGREIIKPVVFTPDAEIIDGAINTTTKKLTFKIRNIGDASLHATTPVRVYLNNESAPSIYNQTLGSALFPGDTRTFEITITDVAGIYDIIVGGTLVNGNLEPGNFPDCDWGNNRETVATFLPREDLATVAHYGTVVIDVFANDILNSPCDNQTLTSTKITTPGGEGVLSGAFGTVYIVNNKIMYTAPGPSYGSNIVKLSYKLTCEGVTRTADIYIYLLESCQGGFTVCRGVSSYEVCLKKEPAEVEFWWYDSDSTYIGNTFPVITNPSSDVTYYVRPHFGDVPSSNLDWYSFRTKSFPLGHITVKVLGTALGADTVRWTGAVDTDWHNPGNWVQVRNGRTLAMTWAPNSNCVDVILGKGCPWYPELNMKTVCRRIHLEDRAMISGIHFLEYESASIDIEPMQKEKDRFVMWSAPLANTYTGDYHFPKAGQSPDWGLVYMNFFQSANPDIPLSVAREKTYTATFGSMGTPLPLGTPFNIYVLPDTEGKRFTFPKSATSYTGANGEPSGALTRNAVGGRFIIDGYLSSSGMLDLPVNAAYSLIQVVNPFPAHLKSADFLAANSASIENSYKIWSGNVDEGFITLLATGDTMRYMITDADVPVETAHWIAPFQSFFVMKRSNAAPFTSLRMTSSMTTTKGFRPGYELRSASSEPGMLRITARQQSYTNTTALYSEAGMSASYDPDEDSRKAFVEGVPVQVYTLTEDREALAINRSGDFSAPVKLGLRLESADTPVTLDFTGVADFGRSVYLIDHEANDREIDLQRSPTYTFAVRPETGGGATEVNARFSLRFGLPSGTETVTRDDVKIYTGQSSIFIDFPVGTITGVAVYNMAGACVYQRHDAMSPVIVPTAPNQLYFIKTFAGNEIYSIHKALVLP